MKLSPAGSGVASYDSGCVSAATLRQLLPEWRILFRGIAANAWRGWLQIGSNRDVEINMNRVAVTVGDGISDRRCSYACWRALNRTSCGNEPQSCGQRRCIVRQWCVSTAPCRQLLGEWRILFRRIAGNAWRRRRQIGINRDVEINRMRVAVAVGDRVSDRSCSYVSVGVPSIVRVVVMKLSPAGSGVASYDSGASPPLPFRQLLAEWRILFRGIAAQCSARLAPDQKQP